MIETDVSHNSQNYEYRTKPTIGTITNIVALREFLLRRNPYARGLNACTFIYDSDN
jgi:hypothetical protein